MLALRVQRQPSENVLHHDDRAVDKYSEVDCSDRQQIRRDVFEIEADECEKQRKRDRHGDDQAGADVVEEKDQDDDDQEHAVE